MINQLLNFIISPANADTLSGTPQNSSYSFIFMFLIFAIFMYFGIWRPQNKRAKEQQNMMNSITKGDEVLTVGGLLGRITKLSEQYVTLTIANNVDIVMQKSAVASVLPKGTLKSIE